MAQEILLKNGERVNRYDHMKQMKRIEKMKDDAKKKADASQEPQGEKPLEKMTVKELQEVAAEKNLEVEGLKKAELLDLLLESEDEDDTGL